MNTVAMKYGSDQEKGRLKLKSSKRSLFSRVPTAAALTVDELDLLRVTLDARDEWIETNANFEHVYEDMLVDYYTYRLKACEARYTYFLKQVKEKGLSHFI